jgi:cation transport protein ChaC
VWVFGYGSLMWDGWEKAHGSTRSARASLTGFRRDFNKASTQNWGSSKDRAPTLGLDPSAASKCEGMAFELPDAARQQVVDALRKREGPSFELRELDVELQSGERMKALVPLNDTSKGTYIGDLSLAERVRMAKRAQGSSGTCVTYVRSIHDKLQELRIADAAVTEFWNEVSRE